MNITLLCPKSFRFPNVSRFSRWAKGSHSSGSSSWPKLLESPFSLAFFSIFFLSFFLSSFLLFSLFYSGVSLCSAFYTLSKRLQTKANQSLFLATVYNSNPRLTFFQFIFVSNFSFASFNVKLEVNLNWITIV